MLKVGAENVAASEIERVIMETGLVAEVAVVGRPDDKLDEVPVAFVVPWQRRDSLVADIEAACAHRLADFKVPRGRFEQDLDPASQSRFFQFAGSQTGSQRRQILGRVEQRRAAIVLLSGSSCPCQRRPATRRS